MSAARLSTRLLPDGAIAAELRCGGQALPAGFRLCGSILVTAAARANCRLVRNDGGYFELAPPDDEAGLAAGEAWEFTIAYKDGYAILNQSWGITGAYLRTPDGAAHAVETTPLEFPSYPDFPAPAPGPAPELLLLPTPAAWRPAGGTCDLTAGLQSAGDPPPGAAEFLALAGRLGLDELSPKGDGAAELAFAAAELPAEAYELAIAKGRVTVRASDASGRFYAMASLLQLAVLHDRKLPCGTVEDRPRFGWRGMHLDCVRHFYQPAYLRRLLDLFALLKLNRFHWHLVDDEAFRLEVPSLPELARTWQRGHGCLVPSLFGSGAGPHGDGYRVADIRAIEDTAAANRMQVMPEIEVPAHSWGLLQVLPGLRDAADESGEVSVQGYRGNVMNPGKRETWLFLEEVIGSVADTFRAPVIHLGCDEIPAGVWTRSPAAAAWMKEHGLADTADVLEKMMQQTAALVTGQGRRPAAWEEAGRGRNGGVGHDALLFSWSGQGPGLEAARAGYEVVMCPAQHTYMDMAPNADPRERGLNWAALVGLADTLAWEPVPPAEPELAKKIVGVQGALWCETVLEDRDCEPMLAPRLLGVAEKAWSQRERTMDAGQLRACAAAWNKIFERIGCRAGTGG
ncbi:MAG: family 20 glycosylhydrolase [Betaproteobacteria bacterium AqS2]|uniref:beta-N-acetylhexosaminidase n=1 Tax=Candidatus Amphirhobacter heronislandensis TaxID=1732024 RepID=A0A930UHH9_9GAMM|nr:family 20 glycosylhydrolase [Betaproteobacteria bacterium AqS2]